MAFGNFIGGGLWVVDPDGTAEVTLTTSLAKSKWKAGVYTGRIWDIKSKFHIFSGRNLHAVQDGVGERYPVVWYTVPGMDKAEVSVLKELTNFGFKGPCCESSE